jgi:hypothetical protein
MTIYRSPEEVRAALERAARQEVHELERKLGLASARNGAAVRALVKTWFHWRRALPYAAGFVLALGLGLPGAFHVTRMTLVRSLLRGALDAQAFPVNGDMDTVVTSTLEALRELAPGADWEISGEKYYGQFGRSVTYRLLFPARRADEGPVLSFHDLGSAIRLDLHGCGWRCPASPWPTCCFQAPAAEPWCTCVPRATPE